MTLKDLGFKFHSSREIHTVDRREEKKGPVPFFFHVLSIASSENDERGLEPRCERELEVPAFFGPIKGINVVNS